MENKEENVSLIKKAYAKFKSSKIYKKIIALGLASALAFSLVGCNKEDLDPGILNGANNNNQNNNQNNNNNENNNQNNNQSNNQNNNEQEIDLTGYSDIIKHLYEDEYFKNLVENTPREHVELPQKYQAIPYQFLEEEGYNINDIKNNNLRCITSSFVLDEEPNNLYIATSVETKANVPYYTQYLLKYTLTEKEIEDYKMMHAGFYEEAMYLNQVIDKLKTPEVLSEQSCTKEIYSELLEGWNYNSEVKQNLGGEEADYFCLLDIDKENGRIELLFIDDSTNASNMMHSSYIAKASLKEYAGKITVNNGIFERPGKYPGFKLEDVSNKKVTYFDTIHIDSTLTQSFFYELQREQNKQ